MYIQYMWSKGEQIWVHLTELAPSRLFFIILGLDYGENVKFYAPLGEHEAHGTLFFIMQIYYIRLAENSLLSIAGKRGRK